MGSIVVSSRIAPASDRITVFDYQSTVESNSNQPDSLTLSENAAPKIIGFDTEVSLKKMGDRGIWQVILSTHPVPNHELKPGRSTSIFVAAQGAR